jgi:hypothetical protein
MKETTIEPWTFGSPKPPTKQQLQVAASEAKAAMSEATVALEYARARLAFLQNICSPHEFNTNGVCNQCQAPKPWTGDR